MGTITKTQLFNCTVAALNNGDGDTVTEIHNIYYAFEPFQTLIYGKELEDKFYKIHEQDGYGAFGEPDYVTRTVIQIHGFFNSSPQSIQSSGNVAGVINGNVVWLTIKSKQFISFLDSLKTYELAAMIETKKKELEQLIAQLK